MFGISVRDEATKYLKDEPKRVKRALIYALFSTGKLVRETVKREGRNATGGGYLNWPKLNPHTGIMAKVDAGAWINLYGIRSKGRKKLASKSGAKGVYSPTKLSTRSAPFARLINMVRSKVYATDQLVEVGFLSNKRIGILSIWDILRKHARGFTRPGAVSTRSRRFFHGIGFPLKSGTKSLRVPARPYLEKVQEREKEKIKAHFAEKLTQRLVGLRIES